MMKMKRCFTFQHNCAPKHTSKPGHGSRKGKLDFSPIKEPWKELSTGVPCQFEANHNFFAKKDSQMLAFVM